MFHQYNRKLQLGSWLTILVWLYGFISVVSAQTLADPNLRVAELMSGLSQPTGMAFIGSDELLVLQKNDGRVRRITNGVLQPGAVLDVHVDNASERGFLGIALHPNFPATNFVYLYYTESSAAADTSGAPLAIVSIVMAGTEALCSIRSLFSTFQRPLGRIMTAGQ
jgi:glucose/arabinose dehydrogenase